MSFHFNSSKVFVHFFLFLFIPIIFGVFIKIYASNFVIHVVASLLGAGNAGNDSCNC